jgi:dihydroorotate dehydrogenase electron transfer subunit
MHTGTGRIIELLLQDGCRYARISCPETLIPGPGQYLLAGHDQDSLLPVPIFHTDSAPQGFIGPAFEDWKPGDVLTLRGPMGRGFSLPASARKVGLVAFDSPPSRLKGLIPPALRQDASIVLLCDSSTDHLPDVVEVQPVLAMREIFQWADYIALDVDRTNLGRLKEKLQEAGPRVVLPRAQVLVRTPMPCGGLADCGVCAVTTRSDWKLACKEGPVFDLREI